jgi:hypothetical protein
MAKSTGMSEKQLDGMLKDCCCMGECVCMETVATMLIGQGANAGGKQSGKGKSTGKGSGGKSNGGSGAAAQAGLAKAQLSEVSRHSACSPGMT